MINVLEPRSGAELCAGYRAARARLMGSANTEQNKAPPSVQIPIDCRLAVQLHYDLPLAPFDRDSYRVFVRYGRGPKTYKQIALAHLRDVCATHGVREIDLRGHTRTRGVAHARQELYYLIARDTSWTRARIAEFLGRDPTSVIHGIKMHIERSGAPALVAGKPHV